MAPRTRIRGTQKAIKRERQILAGCQALATRYRIDENRLITIHQEIGKQIIENASALHLPAGVQCTVTILDLAGETLRVTDVRRSVEGERVK